jgi:hypothetical protein
VYDTSEIPALLDDLGAHLRAQGWEGTLALRQSNETPLAPLASTFTPEVAAAIRSVHAADFERFAYTGGAPPAALADEEYPRALLVAVGLLAERAERVGDLAIRAQDLTHEKRELAHRNRALARRNKALAERTEALRAENKRLSSRRGIGSLAGRVRRKLARREPA